MMEMVMLSLMAPLVIALTSAFFAIIITVTDSIVNNYGECTININKNKKSLVVNGGSNMLITLSNQEIYIPSACGGRGSCGECKVQVASDIGPILPTELPYLSEQQIKDNVRLSCQNKVRGDIDIEIPEYLFNCRRYEKGIVEKMDRVTHDIIELHVRLPEEEVIQFSSGQYVQIVAPPYNKKTKEDTQRAYSIASMPSEKQKVELLVRLVPDGIVTTYVHEHLREGQHITLIGPFGEFYVRDTDAAMICVAGGSGMAPFKSIFRTMIETGEIEKRDVWYFFGAVKMRDMYYLDWLTELDKQYSRFHFVPALSDPDPDDKWNGETGLITEVLDAHLKEKANTAAVDKEGYLCGSPGMLDACIEVMKKNNMITERIFFDKFA